CSGGNWLHCRPRRRRGLLRFPVVEHAALHDRVGRQSYCSTVGTDRRGGGRIATTRAAQPGHIAVRCPRVPGSPIFLSVGVWRAAMIHSPVETKALFYVGPVAISEPVIISWVIMALLVAFAVAVTRRLSLMPSKAQTVLELFVGVIDDQIRGRMQAEPSPYR